MPLLLAHHAVRAVRADQSGLEVREKAVETALEAFAAQLRVSPCPGIESLVELVSKAVQNASACDCLYSPLTDYVMANYSSVGFYGSTVTLLDDDGQAICSPYVYCPDCVSFDPLGDVYAVPTDSLMDQSYGINEQQWLRVPVDTQKAVWSDPYFDDGGGNIEMETYSLPILDNGSVIAVATTDLPISSASKPLLGVGFVSMLAWMLV